MKSLARRLALFVILSLALVGCSSEPTERFAQARAAAEAKDLEAFAKFFTRDSATFLRNMVESAARSKIPYLKDPFAILPEGDVEDVNVEGQAAVLKVKGKKSVEVRMFMENDEWSIDLFSLPRVWEPLGGAR